jgi:hypothetical protein
MSPSRSARYLAPLTKEERDTLTKVGFRHHRPEQGPSSCTLRGRFVCGTPDPDPVCAAPPNTTYPTLDPLCILKP